MAGWDTDGFPRWANPFTHRPPERLSPYADPFLGRRISRGAYSAWPSWRARGRCRHSRRCRGRGSICRPGRPALCCRWLYGVGAAGWRGCWPAWSRGCWRAPSTPRYRRNGGWTTHWPTCTRTPSRGWRCAWPSCPTMTRAACVSWASRSGRRVPAFRGASWCRGWRRPARSRGCRRWRRARCGAWRWCCAGRMRRSIPTRRMARRACSRVACAPRARCEASRACWKTSPGRQPVSPSSGPGIGCAQACGAPWARIATRRC